MTPIRYSRAFRENVKGALKARFRLDATGNPVFAFDDEDPNLRHYTIDLSLQSPNVGEIFDVTYLLDEDLYSDPLLASDDYAKDFTVEIFSYGDFEVEVSVLMGAHLHRQRAWLSSLLEAGHAGDASKDVRDAIQRIKSHSAY